MKTKVSLKDLVADCRKFDLKSLVFGQKMYFTEKNRPKGEPHENEFWAFSNSEMTVRNRA